MINQGISYIPQESSLFNYMSVEDNLMLPLEHLARRNNGLSHAGLAPALEDCFVKFPVLKGAPRPGGDPPAASKDGGIRQCLSRCAPGFA